ncbi:MAG: acyl-CoA dehydrogenase family protein [Burkholderiaceae bacterium]|nr:acyl-CoA dehydrogenase family protein [Burkholderiaceae bacterium]
MSAYGYEAPLRTMRFVIEEVLAAPRQWAAIPSFADLDAETAAEVLIQAGRFASQVLLPLNAVGDRQGCRLEGGRVRTPDGFPAAWRAFVEGGWPALACDPEWGGQGLPQLLNAALFEMLVAANHAWTMYPGLLHGAYETIAAHASDELKARYLPKLVSGEWLAAMALTEPQAGSDLALVRTRAEPRADGTLAVSGSKIFISGGDHDLSDNIVHLVLCRLNDPVQGEAPAGTKGLSLVLVPTVLPDGTRNTLGADGLEHKMGIHGSATCAMRYDGATGWLVGQPHRGLSAMFLMMNAARLHVALQGLGHAEIATQNARRYAAERVQFGGAIDRHPAMRRTLLDGQAMVEGLRVLMYRAAMRLDEAEHLPDAARRAAAAAEASLLTPVLKAFGTAQGFARASAALQVWGGYGYIADYGIEQTLRDARIAMIYEGTNEIQAIDLLQRKVLGRDAAAFEALLQDLERDAGAALAGQLAAARAALTAVRARAAVDPSAPLRVADDFLAGVAHLLLAWAWQEMARAAQRCDAEDKSWLAGREAVAAHGTAWLLPQAVVHWQRVREDPPLPQVQA